MPSHAPCQDDVETFLRFLVQAWNVFRPLFEIAVHNNGPASPALLQSGRDCSVLAEITAEPDRPYRRIGGCEISKPLPGPVRAAIVYQDQLVAIAYLLERLRDSLV